MKNYGDALKYQRDTNGYSQRDLAKATGIRQQNISRWENNQAIPSIENCEILADFYGITIDELIGRELKD
ncbi:MAG: helix-turn-helix transcriptional regulator [Clostridia bacterium]|nr:helix-turn-helix transcriptional regulator [Clostridia bacterium]